MYLPTASPGTCGQRTSRNSKSCAAVARDAELIVMDEPSAALTCDEMHRLHNAIRSLKDRGRTVVLVSHILSEVLELADEVTILRDGRVVRSGPCANENEESLIEAMLGRALDATFPLKPAPPRGSPVVLSVKGLSAPGVKEASLDVHEGEIEDWPASSAPAAPN